MAPTQLSIVLERLLNELGIANLSIGEMRAKMQAELREQLDALQISMEAEARRADAAEA